MTRRHYCIPVIIIAVAAISSACGPSTPVPTPTPTPCPPIPLVAPQVFSPTGELVPSLQPSFQWFYEAACGPDAFGLEVALDGDFGAPSIITEQAPVAGTPWTLTQALQPASMYRWRVYAIQGFTTGPYSPEPWFWTGPICNANIPEIPELVSPIQGAIVNDPSPPLDWSFPDIGCLPEGYQFEVSMQSDFLQTGLSGSGSGPWTSFETNVDFLLHDCTDYFWRVGITNNGQVTAYSDVEEFSTDFQGACSAAISAGPEIYAIGCVGTQSTMISFEFPEPPQDTFEARALGNLYECELNPARSMLLHCTGPRIEDQPEVMLELLVVETQEVVFSEQTSFPQCEPCSGLSMEACQLRSDCEWVIPFGSTGFAAGACQDQ